MAIRHPDDAAAPRPEIALSLAHMCVDRGFDSLDPSLELSVADALYRLYDADLHTNASGEVS